LDIAIYLEATPGVEIFMKKKNLPILAVAELEVVELEVVLAAELVEILRVTFQ
jgi:hypothetical protein